MLKHKISTLLPIKHLLLGALAGVLIAGTAGAAVASVAPAPLVSADSSSKTAACAGLSTLDSSESCGSGAQSSISSTVKTIINILSVVVGIAAVIAIIVAGLKFVTSGGDSNSVASAKSTLIYAIVGLVIVALAQVIVHFTLSSTSQATQPCATNAKILATDPSCKP